MWELCLYITVQVVFLSVCKVQYFNEYCTVRAIRRLEWVCMIPAPYSFCIRQRSESDVLSVVLRSNSWIQTQIFQSDCLNLIVIRTKKKKNKVNLLVMFYTFNLLDSSLISRDYHLQTGFTFPFLVGQQNPMYSLNITHPIELGRLFYCCWPHRYYVFMRQCHKISSHFLFRFRLESSKFAGLRPRL